MGLRMIKAQGGIFGWVADSGAVLDAINNSENAMETSHRLAGALR
jgi:hypothetical protein